MCKIFFEYDRTCGYRRLHSELKDIGFRISEKKTREMMQDLNLKCEIRQKSIFKDYSKSSVKEEHISKNILNQNFKTDKPNKKFCTDMTILETHNGPVFCSVIIDLFNLQPLGLQMSKSCNTDLAKASFDSLMKQRNISGAIFHSDQGVTYKNKKFSQLLHSANVVQSMSRKGYPYDNCLMENFWGTLKAEKIYRLKKIPNDEKELREIVEGYIEFYINKRKSSVLGNLTPKQYYDRYVSSELKN